MGEYFICISIWHNASKWAKSSYESLPDVSSLVTVCGLTCVHTHSYELVLLIISKSSGCFDMVSASHLFGCNIIYIDSSANWYTLLTNVTILQWCSSAKVSPSISQSNHVINDLFAFRLVLEQGTRGLCCEAGFWLISATWGLTLGFQYYKGGLLLTGVARHGNLCCVYNLLQDRLCSRLEEQVWNRWLLSNNYFIFFWNMATPFLEDLSDFCAQSRSV